MKNLIALAMTLLTMTFAGNASAQPRKEVLVVVSSESQLELRDGARYQTGFYLNELANPVQRLIAAGYTPVFANPKGNRPTLDARSNDKSYFGGDEAKRLATMVFVEGLEGLENPRPFEVVLREGIDRYAGVFVPGGHAPMQDLSKDAQLGEILRRFHAAGKPTALICHGPIALLATLPNADEFQQALIREDDEAIAKLSDSWTYAGYRMAVFSTAEERVAEGGQLGGLMRFYPAEALAAAGARVEVAAKWQSQVVQDRELITGQNPFSDEALADTLIAAMTARAAQN